MATKAVNTKNNSVNNNTTGSVPTNNTPVRQSIAVPNNAAVTVKQYKARPYTKAKSLTASAFDLGSLWLKGAVEAKKQELFFENLDLTLDFHDEMNNRLERVASYSTDNEAPTETLVRLTNEKAEWFALYKID